MNRLHATRRSNDQNIDGNLIGRLLTMTDLMALLLCFFVLMYATRDPVDLSAMRTQPTTAAMPTVVPAQTGDAKSDAKLKRSKAGLDLNYIAALFRQAQTRDATLARANVTTYDYALAIAIPAGDNVTARAVVERLASYGRIVQVFGDDTVIAALAAETPEGNVRYFPQNRPTPIILIH